MTMRTVLTNLLSRLRKVEPEPNSGDIAAVKRLQRSLLGVKAEPDPWSTPVPEERARTHDFTTGNRWGHAFHGKVIDPENRILDGVAFSTPTIQCGDHILYRAGTTTNPVTRMARVIYCKPFFDPPDMVHLRVQVISVSPA